jgi:kynurenine formamidase
MVAGGTDVTGPRRVDLSHPIEAGMETYPGLPGPVVCDFLSRERSREVYQGKAEFQIDKIELVGNTGTYIDSPFHRFADGIDIAALPLERIAGVPGVVVRAGSRTERGIGPELLAGLDVAGRAVLIETGWSVHWRTPAYFAGFPFLTRAGAELLRDHGAALVGIESLNMDDMDDLSRPAHTILLGAGIPVVEHLRGLDALPDGDFRFFAVPAPFKGVGTFPVRAYAEVG